MRCTYDGQIVTAYCLRHSTIRICRHFAWPAGCGFVMGNFFILLRGARIGDHSVHVLSQWETTLFVTSLIAWVYTQNVPCRAVEKSMGAKADNKGVWYGVECMTESRPIFTADAGSTSPDSAVWVQHTYYISRCWKSSYRYTSNVIDLAPYRRYEHRSVRFSRTISSKPPPPSCSCSLRSDSPGSFSSNSGEPLATWTRF